MKINTLLSLLLVGTTFFSCIEHEIIPAPIPTVVLKSKFNGLVNGVSTEYTEGVAGYTCLPTKNVNLLPSPSLSSAIYISQISSPIANSPLVKIKLGKIYWDAGVSSDPALTDFNSFFTQTSNILPVYKDDNTNGFSVEYQDQNGTVYVSNENSTNFQDSKFTNITQESDATGDYSKFVCTFNCYVYYSSGPSPAPGLDSLKIQNAQFKGWFKK